jgi:acyl-ACP thioesterase
MLLDEATRRFVFPAEAGVEIRGRKEEPDRILRGSLRAPAGAVLTAEQRWTAPFSRIDINGHVGNAAYFDLLDDLLHGEGGPAGTGCAAGSAGGPRGITAEYLTEVRPGAELRLRLLRVPGDGDAETYYFEGVSADGGKPFFRIEMQMDRDTEEKQ